MYPQYPFPPPPSPPQKRGLSTLTIVLLVLGGMLILGFGGCMVLGGLVFLGAASAQKELLDGGSLAEPGAPQPSLADPSTPPPTVLGDNDDEGDGVKDDAKDDTRTPTGATGSSSGGGTTGKWMCNATGWVRVCGFANVCNNMLMSGTGVGTDRQSAYNMAKLACEGMIRARGGYGTCNVACTPNAH